MIHLDLERLFCSLLLPRPDYPMTHPCSCSCYYNRVSDYSLIVSSTTVVVVLTADDLLSFRFRLV